MSISTKTKKVKEDFLSMNDTRFFQLEKRELLKHTAIYHIENCCNYKYFGEVSKSKEIKSYALKLYMRNNDITIEDAIDLSIAKHGGNPANVKYQDVHEKKFVNCLEAII